MTYCAILVIGEREREREREVQNGTCPVCFWCIGILKNGAWLARSLARSKPNGYEVVKSESLTPTPGTRVERLCETSTTTTTTLSMSRATIRGEVLLLLLTRRQDLKTEDFAIRLRDETSSLVREKS